MPRAFSLKGFETKSRFRQKQHHDQLEMSNVGARQDTDYTCVYQPALAVTIFKERYYASLNYSESIAQFMACVHVVYSH